MPYLISSYIEIIDMNGTFTVDFNGGKISSFCFAPQRIEQRINRFIPLQTVQNPLILSYMIGL